MKKKSCISSVCPKMIRILRGRCEDLEGGPSGAAVNCLESEVAAEIHELMAAGLSVIQLLEDELHINWKMICQIPHDSLEERKICMEFLPHSLQIISKDQKVLFQVLWSKITLINVFLCN
jgi:hypothetical protein